MSPVGMKTGFANEPFDPVQYLFGYKTDDFHLQKKQTKEFRFFL